MKWGPTVAMGVVVFLVAIGAGFGIGWGARATQDTGQMMVRDAHKTYFGSISLACFGPVATVATMKGVQDIPKVV